MIEIEIEQSYYKLKDLERVLRRARNRGANQGKIEIVENEDKTEQKIIIKCN